MPEEQAKRRGRPPRPQPAEPTGYRATALVRRQLLIAQAFTDEKSLQAVIDRAVRHYLQFLRDEIPGLNTALDALETEMAGQSGNVTRIHRPK